VNVPGIEFPKQIGDLTFDENGLLWGGIAGLDSNGKAVAGIFAYDPAGKKVEKSKVLVQRDAVDSMFRPYYMRWENNLLYTTIGRQLIVVEPATLKYTKLLDQTVNLMTVGLDGSVYYVYGSKIYKLPVALDKVILSSAQSEIQVGKETALKIEGTLINGRSAYVYAGDITYNTSDSNIAKVENGMLKALSEGTVEVWASVTLDKVTKETNRISITVTKAEEPENPETPETPQTPETPVTPVTPSTPSGNGQGEEESTELSIDKSLNERENGQTESVITIADKTLPSGDENQSIVITDDSNADVLTVNISAALLKEIVDNGLGLMVKNDRAAYSVPVENIDIDEIVKILNAEADDITINISIEAAAESEANNLREALEAQGYSMVAEPISFSVKATCNDEAVEIDEFTSYVECHISIPEGVSPDTVKTAVIVEADGSIRHVPTRIEIIDGKATAVINTITNGTIVLINNEVNFQDTVNHWAEDAIKDLGERMIITGYNSETFAPDKNITRAEFISIVVKALGLKPEDGASLFADVDENSWYSSAVSTGYRYGLIMGSDGKYRPEDEITREEAMTIIARAMNITALQTGESNNLVAGFADGQSVSDWAMDAVEKCLEAGLVQGRSNNVLAPGDNITRAEVVTIVQRLLVKSGLI